MSSSYIVVFFSVVVTMTAGFVQLVRTIFNQEISRFDLCVNCVLFDAHPRYNCGVIVAGRNFGRGWLRFIFVQDEFSQVCVFRVDALTPCAHNKHNTIPKHSFFFERQVCLSIYLPKSATLYCVFVYASHTKTPCIYLSIA